MSDQEAPTRRSPWPMIVILGLAVFGAIALVQFVVGLAFTVVKLAIVVAVVAALVMFFRGPPDGGRR